MNAQVQPSLLLSSIAAEHIARCRAAYSAQNESPVEAAMVVWWQRLKRHQRRALLLLAGVDSDRTGSDWRKLPATHRAAVVLIVPEFLTVLHEIRLTLSTVRDEAMALLKREAEAAAFQKQAAA